MRNPHICDDSCGVTNVVVLVVFLTLRSLGLSKISKTMVLQTSSRGVGSSQKNSILHDIGKKNSHTTSPNI